MSLTKHGKCPYVFCKQIKCDVVVLCVGCLTTTTQKAAIKLYVYFTRLSKLVDLMRDLQHSNCRSFN